MVYLKYLKTSLLYNIDTAYGVLGSGFVSIKIPWRSHSGSRLATELQSIGLGTFSNCLQSLGTGLNLA